MMEVVTTKTSFMSTSNDGLYEKLKYSSVSGKMTAQVQLLFSLSCVFTSAKAVHTIHI